MQEVKRHYYTPFKIVQHYKDVVIELIKNEYNFKSSSLENSSLDMGFFKKDEQVEELIKLEEVLNSNDLDRIESYLFNDTYTNSLFKEVLAEKVLSYSLDNNTSKELKSFFKETEFWSKSSNYDYQSDSFKFLVKLGEENFKKIITKDLSVALCKYLIKVPPYYHFESEVTNALLIQGVKNSNEELLKIIYNNDETENISLIVRENLYNCLFGKNWSQASQDLFKKSQKDINKDFFLINNKLPHDFLFKVKHYTEGLDNLFNFKNRGSDYLSDMPQAEKLVVSLMMVDYFDKKGSAINHEVICNEILKVRNFLISSLVNPKVKELDTENKVKAIAELLVAMDRIKERFPDYQYGSAKPDDLLFKTFLLDMLKHNNNIPEDAPNREDKLSVLNSVLMSVLEDYEAEHILDLIQDVSLDNVPTVLVVQEQYYLENNVPQIKESKIKARKF